jgi:predicted nucleic acid-binding protein
MSDIVVFDTSVLIDQIRTNRHLDRMLKIEGVVRNSAVVFAELRRGATTLVDRQVIESLERNQPTFTPTEKNWLESGRLLSKIRTDHGFEPHKLRDLHFDVLIALTVRSHGACLITSNRDDFELIREYRDFNLEVW